MLGVCRSVLSMMTAKARMNTVSGFLSVRTICGLHWQYLAKHKGDQLK